VYLLGFILASSMHALVMVREQHRWCHVSNVIGEIKSRMFFWLGCIEKLLEYSVGD